MAEFVATTCGANDGPVAGGVNPVDMMHSGLAGMVSAFRKLKQSENDFVLATIVESQGSTYRKAGARMLITRSGNFYGLLGGGCFESDLMEHANRVFETRKPRELLYDMRSPEDLVWGLGLGCNGAVRIWLEYLSVGNDFAPMPILETALATQSPSVFITTLTPEPAAPASHYLFGDTDKIPVELNPPDEYIAQASMIFESGNTALVDIDTQGGRTRTFFSRLNPPVQLLIIGGGPDAQPVIMLSRLLGWSVTVVDYRYNYSRPENFPAAHQVICATPEQLADTINLDKTVAVILMTHKYEYDLRYLQQLTRPALRYIGLLGPTARRNELLKAVGSEVRKKFGDRIYGPVGLNIGGELPEEIALSLIAEIQAVLNRRQGGHLAAAGVEDMAADMSGRVGCIVLAAGGSTRFGALKQLLEYNGSSLLKRVVNLACEVFDDRVIVIHGPKPTKCQRDIAACKVKNIINEDWELGMSGSITRAIRSVPPDYDAVLMLLCDQPLIGKEQIDRLMQARALNPDYIIASAYADTAGVPAIIPRKFFSKLLDLTGDQGARQILVDLASEVVTVPMPEAEFDIDTQDDFASLLRHRKQG